jgi:hypothetical protein
VKHNVAAAGGKEAQMRERERIPISNQIQRISHLAMALPKTGRRIGNLKLGKKTQNQTR